MSKPINIYEAKTQLSALVDRASAGEEIVIAKAGVPLARLVPFEPFIRSRVPGNWAGRGWIADEFDAPMSDAELADWEGE